MDILDRMRYDENAARLRLSAHKSKSVWNPDMSEEVETMGITIGEGQARTLLEKGALQAQELVQDPSKVGELLTQLEGKIKEVPVIGETLSDIPVMVSMIKSYITGEYAEISPKVIASLVGAMLYLLKREDLISDSVPVLGLADDLAVMGLALKLSAPELKTYSGWKAARESPDKNGEADEEYSVSDAEENKQ